MLIALLSKPLGSVRREWISPTMDQWGYYQLVISLAGTREPLDIINRLGNVSNTDSAIWIDFNRSARRCIFVFGMDAR